MERQTSFGRPRTRVPTTTAPTVSTQYFAHNTPTAQPSLDTTSAAFATFFGRLGNLAERTGDAMRETERVRIAAEEKAKKDTEARRRKAQAQADALQGIPPDSYDPSLYDIEHYSATLGEKAGQDAAQKWKALSPQLPKDAPIEALRADFLDAEFGKGSDDDIFNAAFLQSFENSTREHDTNLLKDRTKQTVLQMRENAENIIGNRAATGELQMDDFRFVIQNAGRYWPEDSTRAVDWAVSAMVKAARSPHALQNLAARLNERGFGPEGESFSALYPAAAAHIEKQALEKSLTAQTLEASAASQEIDIQLTNPDNKTDPVKQSELLATIMAFGRNYGATTKTTEYVKHWIRNADEYLEKKKNQNELHNALIDPQNNYVSPEKINKEMSGVVKTMLNNKGIQGNWWNSTEGVQTALWATLQVRSLASDMAGQAKNLLAAPTSQETQANAYAFFDALEKGGMSDAVHKALSGDTQAYTKYLAVTAFATAYGNVDQALKYVNGKEAELSATWKAKTDAIDWKAVTGNTSSDTKDKVYAEAVDALRKDLRETYESDINIPANILSDAMNIYGNLAIHLQSLGTPDYQDVARKAAAKHILSNSATVVGLDGRLNIVPAVFAPDVYKANAVPTPIRANLWKNQDLPEFARRIPELSGEGVLYDTRPDKIYSLAVDSDTMNTGAYRIYKDAQPMSFIPGQTLQTHDPYAGLSDNRQEIVLDKNPEEALRQLQQIFKFIPGITVRKSGLNGRTWFDLTYTHHDPVDPLPELEATFKQKAGGAAPRDMSFIHHFPQ